MWLPRPLAEVVQAPDSAKRNYKEFYYQLSRHQPNRHLPPTCGGNFAGNVYTTRAVAGDCTVAVTFARKLLLFVGNSYTFGRVDPVMSYNTANVSDLTLEMWHANSTNSNADEPHPWGGIPGVFKIPSGVAPPVWLPGKARSPPTSRASRRKAQTGYWWS